MRIQILHLRDPDSSCDHRVWIDDVEVTPWGDTITVESIDPGAGYTREDWDESIEEAKKDTSAFGQAYLALLLEYSDTKWIMT